MPLIRFGKKEVPADDKNAVQGKVQKKSGQKLSEADELAKPDISCEQRKVINEDSSVVKDGSSNIETNGKAVVKSAGSISDFVHYMISKQVIDAWSYKRALRLSRQYGRSVLDMLIMLDAIKQDDILHYMVDYLNEKVHMPFEVSVAGKEIVEYAKSNRLDERGMRLLAVHNIQGALVFSENSGETSGLSNRRYVVILSPDSAFRNVITLNSAYKSGFHVSKCYLVPSYLFWRCHTEVEKRIREARLEEMLRRPIDKFEAREFVEDLIKHAAAMEATDVHFGLFRVGKVEAVLVRYRIDGILQPMFALPPEVYDRRKVGNILNVIVDMCGSSGKWKSGSPFDGKISIKWSEGVDIDVRVSIIPNVVSHSTVMRILVGGLRGAEELSLNTLGFHESQAEIYESLINSFSGVMIVAGPTGSGKSTTLNVLIRKLEKLENNVVTVEDPVEYTLKNARQVQIDQDRNITFHEVLRRFLRHDPDVILVGEIRDEETANMAFQASVTGHLVLTTIHANNTISILTRLRQYNVDVVLLKSALKCVSSQRLVRKVCPYCSEWVDVDPKTKNALKVLHGIDIGRHKVGRGCDRCGNTGYIGRTVIAEVVPVQSVGVDVILDADVKRFKEALKEKGILTIEDHAIMKVKEGITNCYEILRVL